MMHDYQFSHDDASRRSFCLRHFRNPCDRDLLTINFKNLKFFKNAKKYLTFTFGKRTFTFGEITFTFGEKKRLLLG